MPKISVIVPVYNVEQYLRRCVDSILAQTFTDFELILVNDGSTDNSGDICDEFAKLDQRVVTIHQNNQGVSAARNAGLDIAIGEYITFIDSDDYVSEVFLQLLYNNEYDLIVSGIKCIDVSKIGFQRTQSDSEIIIYKNNIDFFSLFTSTIMHSPVAKLFKRDIISKRFNCNISWGEDTVFVIDFLENITSLIILNNIDYFYVRYNNESTLSTRIVPTVLDDVVFAREYCIDFVSRKHPEKTDEIKAIYTNTINWLCIDYLRNTFQSKLMTIKEKEIALREFFKNTYVQNIKENLSEFLHKSEPLYVALTCNNPKLSILYYNIRLLNNKLLNFCTKIYHSLFNK